MVLLRVVFQREVLRTLVQILQAQQGANPLVEGELVADHNVGRPPQLAKYCRKTSKNKAGHRMHGSKSVLSARRKTEIFGMQRLYLRTQCFDVTVVVDYVICRTQPLLSGNL